MISMDAKVGNVGEGVGGIGGIKRGERINIACEIRRVLDAKKQETSEKGKKQNIYTPLQIMLAIVMRECAELDRLFVSEADSGARVVEEEASSFGCPSRP